MRTAPSMCPARGTTTRRDPAIPWCIASASASGTIVSSSPCTIVVGQSIDRKERRRVGARLERAQCGDDGLRRIGFDERARGGHHLRPLAQGRRAEELRHHLARDRRRTLGTRQRDHAIATLARGRRIRRGACVREHEPGHALGGQAHHRERDVSAHRDAAHRRVADLPSRSISSSTSPA